MEEGHLGIVQGDAPEASRAAENEAKRLKHENVYHHEYARIKNYLDTTVIDPIESGRLEERKKEILAMAGDRKQTKYDELLNGK